MRAPTNRSTTVSARALFDTNSLDATSELFYIWPGTVGVLQAFDFPGWVKADPDTGAPGYEPTACVSMVILKAFDMPQDSPDCFQIYTRPYITDEILAEEVVMVDGCPWALSACRNIGLIDVPGMYRLTLYDETMVGNVQVYLTLQKHALMQRPSNLFLGG